MEIAIGIVFLALFAGAFFLLVLITAFYFWRKSKRRSVETNRQFSSTRSQFIENDSIDDNYSDDNDFAFAEASDYAETSNSNSDISNENSQAVSSMSFESASEGGGYSSGGSDYSDSSSSSSDSSSSDSGSSSSWD
jgi:uncharacterized membrane protein YgcG